MSDLRAADRLGHAALHRRAPLRRNRRAGRFAVGEGIGGQIDEQPLVRDLSIDFARQQLRTSQINRDIADICVQHLIESRALETPDAVAAVPAATSNTERSR